MTTDGNERSIVRLASRHFVLCCGVLPAVLTAVLAVYRPVLLAQLDYRVYDSMVRASADTTPPANVRVVRIDDRSLSVIGQWPWRREVIAQLVTRAYELGAAVVALDMVFAEPDRHDVTAAAMSASDSELALAAALNRRGAVLGYALTFDGEGRPSPPCVLHPLGLAVLQPAAADAPFALARATGAICSLPALAQAAGASGFLNASPDADGILRRVPLLIEYDDRIHAGLALAAVLARTGGRSIAMRLSTDRATSLIIGDRVLPLDGSGNALLRFRRGEPAFPSVSAADLLRRDVPEDGFKNALVFVGATALGTGDDVSTPVGTRTPGVEVQATVADNLLRQSFISRPEHALALEIAVLLGFGVATALLVAKWRIVVALLFGGAALVTLWTGAAWLLAATGTHLSPVFPMIGLVASLAVATIAKLGQERLRADRAADETDLAHRLMVQSLLSLTEIRDAETGSHSRRTQTYSKVLAEQLCDHPRFRDYLTRERIDLLASLAPLHDIGKVGVPDHLLNKPGALTPEEFGEMKKHPAYGLDVITRAQRDVGADDDLILDMAKDIVYTHHERWDGQGYPRGLKGEQIPIPGRLIALVDVYDALTTPRRYRQPLTHEMAVELITDGTGTHFDPAVVDAFLQTAPILRTTSVSVAGSVSVRDAAVC